MKEGSDTYNIILDKIQAHYCAQDSGEVMRDSNQALSKQLCRAQPRSGATSAGVGIRNTPSPHQGLAKLPANTGNLISHAYYMQVKGWFEVMRVPEKNRTEDQKKYLESFV